MPIEVQLVQRSTKLSLLTSSALHVSGMAPLSWFSLVGRHARSH